MDYCLTKIGGTVQTMIEVKRKLFPEFLTRTLSAPSVMTVSNREGGKPLSDRQNVKRNTTVAALFEGDSLANVVPIIQNRISCQRMDTSITKCHKHHNNNFNPIFKPSVLMNIDGKENRGKKIDGRAQTKLKRGKKVNTDKKNTNNKLNRSRSLRSNIIENVTSCLETQNDFLSKTKDAVKSKCKVGMRSNKSKIVTKRISLKKSVSESKSKAKQVKKKKTIVERLCRKNTIPNGDSLMTYLPESSSAMSESISVVSVITQKVSKSREKRSGQIRICNHEYRSTSEEPIDASHSEKMLQENPKRTVAVSLEAVGLGAFVGITTENPQFENSRIGSCSRRFVSPLDVNNLKKTSLATLEELKSSKKVVNKKTKNTTIDNSTVNEVPSVIIMPSLRQREPSHRWKAMETLSTIGSQSYSCTELYSDKSIMDTSKVRTQRSNISSNSIKTHFESRISSLSLQNQNLTQDEHTAKLSGVKIQQPAKSIKIRTKNEISLAPLGSPKKFEKENCPKYSVGTTFKKHFPFHGRFVGIIVSFEQNSGLYKVRYEDGDVEELEESELQDFIMRPKKTQLEKDVKGKDSLQFGACAFRRRSRKLSSGQIESLDSTTKHESQASEANKSIRKSKRRKSQPIRLIDSAKQSTSSTGKKKRKRPEQKAKVEQGHNCITKKPKLQDDENTANNEILSSTTRKTRSQSKTNRVQNCHEKSSFDDALKAIMPVDNNTGMVTKNPEKAEDDVFNSTPMRRLFQRPASDAFKSDITNQQKHNINPKKGKEHPKKRDFEESKGKKSKMDNKSAIKKGTKEAKVHRKGKKGVRISNEYLRVASISDEKNIEVGDPWSQADLKALHRAHKSVDPTSFSFWEDIADMIGSRSAMECRQKWFSLAKTPEPKKNKEKKRREIDANTAAKFSSFDDDIFNSTPMRSTFDVGGNTGISNTVFEELGDIYDIDFENTIAIMNRDDDDDNQRQPSNQVSYPHGYKTYLQKMGRVMRQKDTKKKSSGSMENGSLKTGGKLTDHVDEGDIKVQCRMSPGGTLQVETFGDTDTEDYLDYESEIDS